jgi:competence protein ComEA
MDRLLPWLRRSGWAYVAAAIALAVVAWRLGPAAGGRGGQPAPSAASTAGSLVTAPDAPRALVHVAGEVRRPGVYPIAAGARVIQAIRRAGGPTPRADLSALNLAAMLQDGQQVLIPARAPKGAPAATGAGKRTGPLSLSSATAEDLEALDGIGPTLAQRIVEWRTAHGGLASVDQLLDVPGIGPARLDALRADVVP